MRSFVQSLCAAYFFAACSQANAANISTEITDQNGRPVPNAVVMIVPDSRAGMPEATTRLAMDRIVDQRDETFIPMVTIIPRGGRIAFTNNDQTMHQVYSFSAVKQFEFMLAHQQKSPPVTFDKVGVAAIGCNIHDLMIAYAFVTDSPWTAITDEQGRAALGDAPAGGYTAQIWHPRLSPLGKPPTTKITVGTAPVVLKSRLSLPPEPKGHRRHGGGY
jgi:plastocyanin